jgi:hypothetical protein
MRQAVDILRFQTAGCGLVEITDTIVRWVGEQEMADGLLTLFCRHTSASLLIQENAAAEVRSDLESNAAAIILINIMNLDMILWLWRRMCKSGFRGEMARCPTVVPSKEMDPAVTRFGGMSASFSPRTTEALVPEVGLEPTHLAVLDFESSASTISPLGRRRWFYYRRFSFSIHSADRQAIDAPPLNRRDRSL